MKTRTHYRTSAAAVGRAGIAAGALLALLITGWLPAVCLGAGDPTPRVLGLPTPGAEAPPPFEWTQLHAVSDDGRWFLLTSTSDRFVTNDLNAAADVLLFDRTTGRASLVSATPDGWAGNGASLAPTMTPDARRVVFQSRATNLVSNDTNGTWDVFARDVVAGTTFLASIATNGASARGASTDPRISTDGRYVLFASEAGNIASPTGAVLRALYRRDLAQASTAWVSQQLTGLGTLPSRTYDADLSDGGQFTVFAAAGSTNQVFLRDIDVAGTARLTGATTFEPPGLRNAPFNSMLPVLSDDGAFAACRFGFGATNGCLWFNVASSAAKAFGLSTNPLPARMPVDLLGPALSRDGRFLAYAQPVRVAGRSDPILQVYRGQGSGAAPILVSGRLGTQEISDAHAFAPRITPDGRFVAFLSYASNIVAGAAGGVLRAYLWDGATGLTTLVADLGVETLPFELRLSANGAWLGVAAPGVGSTAIVYLCEVATGQVTPVPLEPAVSESATGRGWIEVRREGVSTEGRHVTLAGFPADDTAGTNHLQIYVLDSQTGTRRLMTEGVNGSLANRHSTTPTLSADGAIVLFRSAAANLVANDVNNVPDFFVQTLATGQRTIVRGPRLPSGASALPEAWLSPNGTYAFLKYAESAKTVSRLARVADGVPAVAFAGTVQGAPGFSAAGHRVAVSRGTLTTGTDARIEIHDPQAWLASVGILPSPLWTSPTTATEPGLSPDGVQVAYLAINTAGTNAVVVMDWAANRRVFARQLPAKVVPSGLRMSADGRFVIWLAPTSSVSAVRQVWCGDISAGTVALVSVAADGVSEGNGGCKQATLTPDGRFVAFVSRADNLVADDTNGALDVFLRDRASGRTLLISRAIAGRPGAGGALESFFSADGGSLFFLSAAPDLVAGDYNQAVDLFKVEVVADSDLLLAIRRNVDTGRAELLWNGQPGKTYGIEFRDDRPAAAWIPVPGEFPGNAPVDLDPNAAAARFFRVRPW